jgi:hypothetical protein
MYKAGGGSEAGTINWDDKLDVEDQIKAIHCEGRSFRSEAWRSLRDRRLIDKMPLSGIFPIVPRGGQGGKLCCVARHQRSSS